jgi:di/tricarboxylate transporter
MNRERALKIVLVLVGLLFLAGVYPLTMSLRHQSHQSHSESEPMMLSVYVTLGIFLLLAARNPLANRSLVAFTAWSSFAHAAVMFIQAFQIASERGELLVAVAVLGIVGVALVALAPAKQSAELASAAGA